MQRPRRHDDSRSPSRQSSWRPAAGPARAISGLLCEPDSRAIAGAFRRAQPTTTPPLDHLTFDTWLDTHGFTQLTGPASTTVATARQLVRTPTPAAAMPTTGNATYTGAMAAIERTPDTSTALHGPLTATADFTNQTLGTQAHLADPTTDTPWGTLTLAPTPITEATFTGRTTSTNGHTGTTTGHFAGPEAEALTGITTLEGPTTLHATFEATRQ